MSVPTTENRAAFHLQAESNAPHPLLDARQLYTSIDVSTPTGKAVAMKAFGDSDFDSEDVINQEIAISDVLLQVIELVDTKTGEIGEHVRSVLISPQGETFGFVSKGVYSCVKGMAAVYGYPPWQPPIKLKVIQRATRNKGSVLLLQPVID